MGAERLSELKSLVSFIDYFKRHLGVELDDPNNEEMIRFSLVVEKTTLMSSDYNDILNEVDYDLAPTDGDPRVYRHCQYSLNNRAYLHPPFPTITLSFKPTFTGNNLSRNPISVVTM